MHLCALNMAARYAVCEYFLDQECTRTGQKLSFAVIDKVAMELKSQYIVLDSKFENLLIERMKEWLSVRAEHAPEFSRGEACWAVLDLLSVWLQAQVRDDMLVALRKLMPSAGPYENLRSGMDVASALASMRPSWEDPKVVHDLAFAAVA